VLIANDQISKALTTDKAALRSLSDEEITIRDCFDEFLSSLITFCHYIDQDLINKDALLAHVGYWIRILGPETDLESRYARLIHAYAEEYMGSDVERLVQKYDKGFSWKEEFPDEDPSVNNGISAEQTKASKN
jgi:hypothetical protein